MRIVGADRLRSASRSASRATTHTGRSFREFVAESHFELRKVVWPTREETLRTTGVIIVVVIIISIILGLIDLMLKVGRDGLVADIGH